MKKNIFGLIALCIALVVNQSASAHMNTEAGSDKHCNCAMNIGSMVDKLNLTPEQQIKIKAIRMQTRQLIQSKKGELQSIRMQSHALVQSDNMDESKLNALVEQRNAIAGTLMKARIIAKNQIYNLLNPEQKAKFDEMFASQKEKCDHCQNQ